MLSEEFEVIFNEIASVLKNEEEFEREAKVGNIRYCLLQYGFDSDIVSLLSISKAMSFVYVHL